MIILFYILEKQEKELFIKGLILLQKMIQNYLPAQSILFQQQKTDYFHTILLRKNMLTMMLMKDIFF